MSDSAKGILIFLAFFTFSCACPNLCTCKWKYGKQTVECTQKGFLAIPEGMDPGTQVLEFSKNNVQTLHKEIFLKMDLINLQRIYLSHCGIVNIDDRTFVGLTNLVELDLSNNLLRTVPTETFVDCPSLMRLSLNANPISALSKNAFEGLSFLNTLELSKCEISEVEEGAFQGLHSLEWLHLDGNKLTALKGSRVLPESLKGIELQENSWQCDCNILDLYTWLLAFKIPHDVEPVCKGPPQLYGRIIKSAAKNEFACLPEVSPTSFFLEINEGKNVSLLCQIHAVPEAKVSWWFQGQMLRNDSIVAPGVHLIYYIEEGNADKRSELFIFNTNTEDNGTYICNAENFAGKSEANFTIRIVVKEEPVIITVSFPFEYLLAVAGGVAALSLVLLIMIAVSIVRCRRNRRRQQKREQTKEMALQYQHNSSKCAANADRLSGESVKIVDVALDAGDQLFAYVAEEAMESVAPVTTANQLGSPVSLKRYQLEQNPDLINDTESVAGRRKEADGGETDRIQETELMNPIIQQGLLQFPVSCMRGSHDFYSANLVDGEGYPVDYGLPKLQRRPLSDNFYMTLPYNRLNKRQSAANPISRYSREAEFLSRSAQPASYEHYCPDVRYTADGYPVRTTANEISLIPSPPEGYKTDAVAPSSLPCCSNQQTPWPTCVPANLHTINSNHEYNQSKYVNVGKRCVGAQTDTEDDATQSKTENMSESAVEMAQEVSTESPDEGYEGESAVVV